KTIEQNGLYSSNTDFATAGYRLGTITAKYSPDGLLESATGEHSATIVAGATATATADDHQFTSTVEHDNFGRLTELTSDRNTQQSDSYLATLTATRTAATETDDDGLVHYRPVEDSTISNVVSGSRDVTNPQTLVTTVNGTTTTEQATPTENVSYGDDPANPLTTTELGFHAEDYGTFGYRGSVNDSNFNAIGGYSGNDWDGTGSEGDSRSKYSLFGRAQGSSNDQSSTDGSNSGASGNNDSTTSGNDSTIGVFSAVTGAGGEIRLMRAPGEPRV
ncbi:MAG: hypothetical protein AAFN77_24740, partial [Planctomycetota bacterium]